jgi:hypothetical protein
LPHVIQQHLGSDFVPPRLQAIVDYIGPVIGQSAKSWWKVTVTEAFPGVGRAVYTVTAVDDNMAAQEGLRRLTAELERPLSTRH